MRKARFTEHQIIDVLKSVEAGLHRYPPRSAEGLSVTGVNRPKMIQWFKTFPGALNDTGDVPVIKHGNGHFG
ncbi:hypothetical protein N7922_00250 [Kosakonia sp. ML.JS2a]|uniref:hypothetical protein n=1 Tax=Kosakonia sp. ML.JS2a TaxID=2980557 RepID=UPI0021DA0845|nr:hypothetical protein [Kosakonia sp. ML.JS2a]UXY10999.1 hypothetical protein N7922_00250 [Kosakonia sp. ML.JS2a]